MSERPSTDTPTMIATIRGDHAGRNDKVGGVKHTFMLEIADRLEELSYPGKRTIESPAEYVRRLNEENLALAEKVKALEAEIVKCHVDDDQFPPCSCEICERARRAK